MFPVKESKHSPLFRRYLNSLFKRYLPVEYLQKAQILQPLQF